VEIAKVRVEVLKKCIITPLDEAMRHITRTESVTGDGHDAMLTVSKRQAPSESEPLMYAPFSENGKESGEDAVVMEIKMYLLITGDLAYYAMLLGREDSTSKWCWLCDLSHRAWQFAGHVIGDPLTLILSPTLSPRVLIVFLGDSIPNHLLSRLTRERDL
jgi:hypothetical protein